MEGEGWMMGLVILALLCQVPLFSSNRDGGRSVAIRTSWESEKRSVPHWPNLSFTLACWPGRIDGKDASLPSCTRSLTGLCIFHISQGSLFQSAFEKHLKKRFKLLSLTMESATLAAQWTMKVKLDIFKGLFIQISFFHFLKKCRTKLLNALLCHLFSSVFELFTDILVDKNKLVLQRHSQTD